MKYSNFSYLFSEKILFILVIISPMLTFMESLNMIFHFSESRTDLITPVYIKGLKDILLVSLILSLCIYIAKTNMLRKNHFFILIILIPTLCYSAFFQNFLLSISGIRWFLPILLAYQLAFVVNRKMLEKLYKPIYIVFLIHLIFQVLQYFVIKEFGVNTLGFSSRNPGIYTMPNASGLLGITVFLYGLFLNKNNIVSFLLITISIFLSSSSAGFLLFFLSLTIYMFRKNIILLSLAFLLCFIMSYFFVESIRPGVFQESFGPRVSMFLANLSNSSFFIGDFGKSTNAIYSISYNLDDFDMPLAPSDSFWGGLPINLGIINFTVFLVINIVCILYCIFNQKIKALLVLIVIFLAGMTTSITEVFPVNILLALLVAKIFKQSAIDIKSFENENNSYY